MPPTILHKRGYSQDLSNVNPILASGELCLEIDTNRIKFGDGNQAWNNIPYAILPDSGVILNNGSGNFTSLKVNNIPVSVSGHTHISSNITNFNSSVSGLLPVTNILGGSNITVSQSGTAFTVAVTGSLGLTTEEVDDRVANLLVAGTGINLNYNDTANSLTISTTGLQTLLTNPVTGIGTSGYVSRWNSTNSLTSGIIFDNGTNIGIGTTTPSGQLHVLGTGIISSRLGINNNNPQYSLDVSGSGNFLNGLAISGVPIGEIIDDEVAGLLVAGSGISLNYNDSANTLTVDTNVSTSLIAGTGISLDYNSSTDELSIKATSNIINSSNLYLWSNFR